MIRKMAGVLSVLALLLAMAIAALLLGTRLGGLTPYGVRDDSMEPILSPGDLILVRDAGPDTIARGMLVTVDAEGAGTMTRRVTGVCRRTDALEPVLRGDGEIKRTHSDREVLRMVPMTKPEVYILTRSIASPQEAPVVVREAQVLGVPVIAIPYVGYAVSLLETSHGRVIAVGIALALVGTMFLPEMMQRKCAGKKKRQRGRTSTEDVLLCDARAAQGDDLVLKARGAREGDDVIIEEHQFLRAHKWTHKK